MAADRTELYPCQNPACTRGSPYNTVMIEINIHTIAHQLYLLQEWQACYETR
jgi:hypothetical protein